MDHRECPHWSVAHHGLEPEAADHSGQKPETDVLKRPLHAGSKPVFCTTGSAVDFRLHSRLVLMERYGVKDVQVRITAQYIVNQLDHSDKRHLEASSPHRKPERIRNGPGMGWSAPSKGLHMDFNGFGNCVGRWLAFRPFLFPLEGSQLPTKSCHNTVRQDRFPRQSLHSYGNSPGFASHGCSRTAPFGFGWTCLLLC
jgi:hypothetical protein